MPDPPPKLRVEVVKEEVFGRGLPPKLKHEVVKTKLSREIRQKVKVEDVKIQLFMRDFAEKATVYKM